MMDTQEIARILAADPYTKHIVDGVVAKDKLPKKIITYPSAFVCNTDDGISITAFPSFSNALPVDASRSR